MVDHRLIIAWGPLHYYGDPHNHVASIITSPTTTSHTITKWPLLSRDPPPPRDPYYHVTHHHHVTPIITWPTTTTWLILSRDPSPHPTLSYIETMNAYGVEYKLQTSWYINRMRPGSDGMINVTVPLKASLKYSLGLCDRLLYPLACSACMFR